MKFHLTANGPKPCQATKQACPLGGEHFETHEAAERAFAQALGGAAPVGRKVLPKTSVAALITPQAGGHYFGCHVATAPLEPYLAVWRQEVGPAKAKLMEELKAQRDRGTVYHLTAITPPEMGKVRGRVSAPTSSVEITYAGIGRTEDRGNEAWYVVCHAPAVQEWRASLGLPQKDLHVTLGFSPKDVHTKSKGDETLVLF